MAKKSKSARHAGRAARTRAGGHSTNAREAHVSESELRRMDREMLRLISRGAALTALWIQAQPNPQKILFSPLADEHLNELIAKSNPGPLPEPAVRGAFREIISGARNLVKLLRVAY